MPIFLLVNCKPERLHHLTSRHLPCPLVHTMSLPRQRCNNDRHLGCPLRPPARMVNHLIRISSTHSLRSLMKFLRFSRSKRDSHNLLMPSTNDDLSPLLTLTRLQISSLLILPKWDMHLEVTPNNDRRSCDI